MDNPEAITWNITGQTAGNADDNMTSVTFSYTIVTLSYRYGPAWFDFANILLILLPQ